MSNCISLRNSEVLFSKDEIDFVKLKVLMDSVPETLKQAELLDKEDDGNRTDSFLFLDGNTIIKPDGVFIEFGNGRSSHTWKDFLRLVNVVIKHLMIKEKSHSFKVKSEGFTSWGNLVVVFGKENIF
jgi:hypothetical protein